MSSPPQNSRLPSAPYWSYGDLGVFLLGLAGLTLGLHVLVQLHWLSKSQLSHPSEGIQITIVLYLMVNLYGVLKLRYRQAVLASLGWILPGFVHGIASLGAGALLGAGTALYQRTQVPSGGITASWPLLLLASLLAPILEESLFRGCLFHSLPAKWETFWPLPLQRESSRFFTAQRIWSTGVRSGSLD